MEVTIRSIDIIYKPSVIAGKHIDIRGNLCRFMFLVYVSMHLNFTKKVTI